MKNCCNNLKWEFVKDVNHARGCDFTYGKCSSCGSDLIHLFHSTVNNDGYYQIVSPEFVTEMLKLEGNELKQFMKKWYDELF